MTQTSQWSSIIVYKCAEDFTFILSLFLSFLFHISNSYVYITINQPVVDRLLFGEHAVESSALIITYLSLLLLHSASKALRALFDAAEIPRLPLTRPWKKKVLHQQGRNLEPSVRSHYYVKDSKARQPPSRITGSGNTGSELKQWLILSRGFAESENTRASNEKPKDEPFRARLQRVFEFLPDVPSSSNNQSEPQSPNDFAIGVGVQAKALPGPVRYPPCNHTEG